MLRRTAIRWQSVAYSAAGERYPGFHPREYFNFDNHPHWFVGHMSKARVKIQQKLPDVDVLLEVRDARAPFTSAQLDITGQLGGRKAQRLVILNKADLITPNAGLAMRNVVEEAGLPCLLTNAAENKNLVKIKHFAMDHVKVKHPRTLGVMLMVVGLPNTGKSTVINGLKRIAFATAKHQGTASKLVQGVKRTEARVTKKPGETHHVDFFHLSHHPRLYCYDTPGISLLKKRNDPERIAKLALLGGMPDHHAGEVYLADYLLYRLNRDRHFNYVEVLELPGPTDDVRYLCSHIAALMALRQRTQVYYSDITTGAGFFVNLFRVGQLGKITLDHIPSQGEIQQLKEMRARTEPPGPWGPPCYPEVPAGLELDRTKPVLRDIGQ